MGHNMAQSLPGTARPGLAQSLPAAARSQVDGREEAANKAPQPLTEMRTDWKVHSGSWQLRFNVTELLVVAGEFKKEVSEPAFIPDSSPLSSPSRSISPCLRIPHQSRPGPMKGESSSGTELLAGIAVLPCAGSAKMRSACTLGDPKNQPWPLIRRYAVLDSTSSCHPTRHGAKLQLSGVG